MEKVTIAVFDFQTTELDIYNTILNDTDGEDIENYLAKQYGRTADLMWMVADKPIQPNTEFDYNDACKQYITEHADISESLKDYCLEVMENRCPPIDEVGSAIQSAYEDFCEEFELTEQERDSIEYDIEEWFYAFCEKH